MQQLHPHAQNPSLSDTLYESAILYKGIEMARIGIHELAVIADHTESMSRISMPSLDVRLCCRIVQIRRRS